MINLVYKKARPVSILTQDIYNRYVSSSQTYYYLLQSTEDEELYIVYWPRSPRPNSALSSSVHGGIDYDDIPFSDIIVMTYDEIKDIHVRSRYVHISHLMHLLTDAKVIGTPALRIKEALHGT